MRSVLIAMGVLAVACHADAQVVQASDVAPHANAVTTQLVGHNPVNRGWVARTATLDTRSGNVVPAVTRLQPVVGSVQRTGHFTNPFTHKAKYTGTAYNPLLGQFSTHTFRR